MDIENLIKNIKVKLLDNPLIQNVKIEDKTYLHAKHSSHQKNKFHLKLLIFSDDLSKINKVNLAVDTIEDFQCFQQVFNAMKKDQIKYTTDEIVDLVSKIRTFS